MSKRGCAFRDIDGHACGGTSHKVTAKALLAVYLRAVYIADAETAAALHEYMHPERADLFVCTVGRDICTATRVDFDEAEREIAKKQAAVKAMRDARAHGTMSAADAAAVVADVAGAAEPAGVKRARGAAAAGGGEQSSKRPRPQVWIPEDDNLEKLMESIYDTFPAQRAKDSDVYATGLPLLATIWCVVRVVMVVCGMCVRVCVCVLCACVRARARACARVPACVRMRSRVAHAHASAHAGGLDEGRRRTARSACGRTRMR